MKTKQEIVEALKKKEAKLVQELGKMRESHLAQYKMHGSELSTGEMVKNENNLEVQLFRVKGFINKVEKEEIDEIEVKFWIEFSDDRVADIKNEIEMWQEETDRFNKFKSVYVEIAQLAGINLSKP